MKIGEVELSWLGHNGFIITTGTSEKRIAIDPEKEFFYRLSLSLMLRFGFRLPEATV